jgi:sugar phosphate permease
MSTPNISSTARSAPQPAKRAGFFSRIGGRYSWTAMIYLWLIYAMNTNMRQWIQIVQPSLVEEFKLTPSAIGFYSGLLTIALGISGIILSPWLDRGGHGWARKYRHLPIVLVYTFFSILTGIGPLTSVFMAVFIFQVIKNLASGVGEAAEVTTVAEWWPLERRGFAQGLHHTGFPWGSLLGGLAISVILGTFGSDRWRYVFLLLPWIVLVFTFLFWRFSNRENYAGFVRDTLERGLTPPLREDADGAAIHAAPGAFWRALANPNILVSSLASGLANFSLMALSFWLPLYLAFISHFSFANVAWLSVLFTITGGVGQVMWGAISDWLGRKYSLILMFLWLTMGYALFYFAGVSIPVLVAVQLLAGMATHGIYPVLYAMASDSCEEGTVAIANGLNLGGLIIGGLGPIAVGAIIEAGGGYASATGFELSLYVIAGPMALAAVMIALFTRETSGRFRHHDRALVSAKSCFKGRLGK